MRSTTPSENDSITVAKESGLRYLHPEKLTIVRVRSGKLFVYHDVAGKKITDKTTLNRIKKLAIPPAYQSVCIAPYANGHLQAIGKDERKRTQYLYHPQWRLVRDANKFHRMLAFGKALPQIRHAVHKDVQLKQLPRQKIVATLIAILDKTHIRIGNAEYAKENKSYGLTTLHNRHVKITGDTIKFSFRGKRGISHQVELHDKRLANIVHLCQDLPGYELFEYKDTEGVIHQIGSTDVNQYLKNISGENFTAKDFRTWHATVLAMKLLMACGPASTKTTLKKNISQVIRVVATDLGNTPAICKKSYIHPEIFKIYTQDKLLTFFKKNKNSQFSHLQLSPAEKATLAFLSKLPN